MEEGILSRESVEYAEILSEVFAALVTRSIGRGAADPEYGLTHALADCLQFIYLHGTCSVGRIAEGLSISEPAASQLVDRLARGGLVVRSESERDRRLTNVSLTGKGMEAASRNKTARQEAFIRVFDRVSPEIRRAFVESREAFLAVALGDEEEIEKFCARCGIDHVAFCVLNRIHQTMTGAQIESY